MHKRSASNIGGLLGLVPLRRLGGALHAGRSLRLGCLVLGLGRLVSLFANVGKPGALPLGFALALEVNLDLVVVLLGEGSLWGQAGGGQSAGATPLSHALATGSLSFELAPTVTLPAEPCRFWARSHSIFLRRVNWAQVRLNLGRTRSAGGID